MLGRLGAGFGRLGARASSRPSLIGQIGDDLPILASGVKVAAIGDSIIQLGFNSPAAANQLTGYTTNEVLVAQGLMPSFRHEIYVNTNDTRPGPSRLFSGANFGVGGDSIAQTKTRLVTNGEVWPCDPDVLIIAVGVNTISGSPGNGQTATTMMADLQAMCEAAMARGIRVVLAKVRPRGISGSTTVTTGAISIWWPAGDARWTTWADLNTAITTYANPALRAVWLWDTTVNSLDPAPASQVGEPRANFTNDGTHNAPLGGWGNGKPLATVLADIITPAPFFNTDPTRADNYARNPTMGGTGGTFTAAANISGSVADSWRLTRSSPVTDLGITVTASKEAYGSNSRQVFSFEVTNPSTANALERFLFQPSTPNISRTGIADNTFYQFWVRCEVNAWPHWRALSWDFHTRTSAPADELISIGWATGVIAQEPLLDDGGTFWVMSQPLKITSTVANMLTYMSIQMEAAGASGTGVLKIDTPLLIPYGSDPSSVWPSGPIS